MTSCCETTWPRAVIKSISMACSLQVRLQLLSEGGGWGLEVVRDRQGPRQRSLQHLQPEGHGLTAVIRQLR